jgi:hypothetical protein
LEDLDIHKRIILKGILYKLVGRDGSTGLIWPRNGTSSGLL